MNTAKRIWLIAISAIALGLTGCKPKSDDHGHDGHDHGAPAAPPSNRVDIPSAVRTNLGITFARVETRNVARTLRVPGRFELLPTARREYRPAIPGRVDLLVTQHQRVDAGTPLYRLDSPRWREILEQIAAAEGVLEQAAARRASVAPVRDSQRQRAEQLTARVAVLADRAKRLEELQATGAGIQRDTDDARTALNQARAELAEVTERGVELDARERELSAESRALASKLELLIDAAASISGLSTTDLRSRVTEAAWRSIAVVEVRASEPGVVESFGVTSGASVEPGAMIVSLVRPELVRFHAMGLQSDLARLKDGLPCRITPPSGTPSQEALDATLTLGLKADAENRTMDLFATPGAPAAWAREGMAGFLEIITEGGSPELAVPLSCIVRDGTRPILFRRDPANLDKAIRMDADVGVNDGRWVALGSGVKEGDEIVLDGVYQLMLATAGNAPKGGHFHSDGTFHEGEDK